MTNERARPDAAAARRGREPLRIGEWVLHPDLGVLRRDGDEQRLTGKALHVLLVLIDARETAVSRDELLDAVWGSNYPSDAVVSRAIADLRNAFGESAGEQAYIRTIPKFGYQLVAERGEPMPVAPQKYAPRRLPAGIFGVVVAGAALAWFFWQISAPPLQGTSWRLPPPQPLTADPGLEHQPRIVAGGEWIAYAALRPQRGDWDLFRVSTSDGVSQSLAASPDVNEHGPAVSPDGEEIAYVRIAGQRCDVVKQSITFGVPESIASCTSKFPTLVDWSPDGRQIAFTVHENDDADGSRRIYLVNPNTGETSQLSSAVSPTGTDFYPRFSPSGQRLAFLRGEPHPDHRTSIWTVDVASGSEVRVSRQPAQIGGMTWIDDGVLLYSINEAGRFETRRRELATGVDSLVDASGLIHPDYLPTEDLLVAVARRSERDLAVISRDNAVLPMASSTSDDHHGAYSPDGSFVAFISRRTGYDELWLVNTQDQAMRRLTRFDGATVRYPSWHPAGQRILFTVQTDGGERLYEIDVVSGTTRPIDGEQMDTTTPSWIESGRRWVYGCNSGGGWGICVADEAGARRVADGFFRPRPLESGQVAVVNSSGALYRLSLDNGAAERIWDGLPGNGRLGWILFDGDLIYSIGIEGANRGRIIRRNLESGAETVLFEGTMPLADTEISVSVDSGDILFTRFDAASDDLVIFQRALASR